MYERTAAGGWQSVRTFRRNGVGDYLGFSVCMDGTSGVAGMPLADGWLGNEVVEDAGEAIFYCKNPNWVCEEDISPSLPRYENVYGGAVSLSGTFVDLLEMPVALLCGFMYPISVLPVWMQQISTVFPIRWGLEGLRASLKGSPIDTVLISKWLIALGISLVYYLLARWFDGKVHDHIRVTGELHSI